MNQSKEHPVDMHGMERFFSNGSLFAFIWKWRVAFIITALAAGLLAVLFSGPRFITPKFKSEIVIYPVNLNEYGDESPTEQMLQILQSTDLRLRLVDAFDLHTHYKIDPDHPFAQSYMFNELDDHVSFSKTSLEAVRITILDKDPWRAAAMADSVNTFYNQLVKSVQNIRTRERIERDSREMGIIQKENDSLKMVLKDLRKKYKLVDPANQTEEITEAYLNRSPNSGEIYNNLLEYRDEIIFLDSLITFNTSRYIEYKDDHDEHVTELNRKLEFSSVISKPIPADKKSYPVRWLILAGTVLSALILCFLALLVLENIRSKKRKD